MGRSMRPMAWRGVSPPKSASSDTSRSTYPHPSFADGVLSSAAHAHATEATIPVLTAKRFILPLEV
jgi:hypothetical protein